MRRDLREFGYCLVEAALSPEQLRTIRTRVVEQAEGERLAEVAFWYSGGAGSGLTTHATQFIPSLVNKGEVFPKMLCHDPSAIQAGPVLEQLLAETVGDDWVNGSFLAIIAGKGGQPQSLHQDGAFHPGGWSAVGPDGEVVTEPPLGMNQVFVLDDISFENGGT